MRFLKERHFSSTISVFILRCIFAGFSFLVMLLAARILGGKEFGLFSYLWGWMMLLVFPGKFGIDELAVCKLPVMVQEKAWSRLSEFLSWSALTTFLVPMITAILWIIAMINLESHLELRNIVFFITGINVIIFVGIYNLFGVFRGIDQPVTGQAIDVSRTVIFAVLLAIVYFIEIRVSYYHVLLISMMAGSATLIFGIGRLFYSIHLKGYPLSFKWPSCCWWREAGIFTLVGSFIILNKRMDVVLLGILATPEQVAYYTIAAKGGELISMVIISINTVIAREISSLWNQAEFGKLQRLLTMSARQGATVMILMAALLFTFDNYYLKLFGDDFLAGKSVLHILLLVPLLQAATGSSHVFLNMIGKAKLTAKIIGFASCCNIALNILLIPRFGATGAAASTVIATTMWVLGTTFTVMLKYKLNPSPISIKGISPNS